MPFLVKGKTYILKTKQKTNKTNKKTAPKTKQKIPEKNPKPQQTSLQRVDLPKHKGLCWMQVQGLL